MRCGDSRSVDRSGQSRLPFPARHSLPAKNRRAYPAPSRFLARTRPEKPNAIALIDRLAPPGTSHSLRYNQDIRFIHIHWNHVMNRITLVLIAIALGAGNLSGCADMSETGRTLGTGAAIGAAAGAVIGAATAGGHRGRSAAKGAAIGAAIGAGSGYLWSRHMQEQKAAMEQAAQGTGVNVTQTEDNQLKLEIPSDISFDTGRHDIKPALRPVLDRFAVTLNQNPVTHVTIVGHSDSTGSDAINDPLSVNRASATRDYLVARGVAATRIAIDGRGSRQPIADNATTAGRAMNRRVEIFVAEAAR
jgi:outer membrane protein OmpA-like peptidoglycan-associated protein